jgi:rfaE bifunctional protein nucleotidyltransferase chain/domain
MPAMASASIAPPLPPMIEDLARALARPLVFTNGVFDLLHAGHVDCLEQARALGASLVVGVHSDASARRLGKGAGRPIHRQGDRLRVVEALAAVSAAVLFDEDAPLSLMRALRPDVYVKGGDYRASDLPEARLVAQWGGCTVIIPRRLAVSTSGVIERVGRLRSHVAA